MPLLRFKTGDIASITHEPCACGCRLIRVQELSGRERDVIRTPDSRRIHGAFFTHFEALHHADWIHRFQIYQPDLQTFILRVILWRDPNEVERQALLDALREGLGDMDFRIEVVDEMEVTRTGKFRVL
jgi:phenylacetate-CoA ligase